MKHNIIAALLVFAATGQPAHAEWRMSRSVDSFTDEEIVEITNRGEVLTGEVDTTELSLHASDTGHVLIWTPPLVHLCNHDRSLQIRSGEDILKGQGHTLSSSRKFVFLTDSFGLMLRASRTGDLRLKYTDGCGNIAVARFTGDPAAYLPQLQVAKNLEGWHFVRSVDSTYVSRISNEHPETQFRVQRFDEGAKSDELGIFLFQPELSGTAEDNLSKTHADITIGDERFMPQVLPMTKLNLENMKWELGPGGRIYFTILQSDVSRAKSALTTATRVELNFGSIRRTFDVTEISDALKFGCGGFTSCGEGRK